MANVLTSLAADIYKAADMVGRELVGFIPSVTINAGAEKAAKDDIVRSAFTRPATVGTITPAMTIPEGTDQTVDNKTMTLDTTASVKIPYTGEDVKHLDNGAGFQTVYGDQIKQAFRAIGNQIEAAIALKVKQGASRAYGSAGTTPFGSNFNELPQLRKILSDNGMPFDGQVSVVMDTSAGANLRSLAQLQKANESGSTELLRQGSLLDLQGFMLKESNGIVLHTKGTGASYQFNGAGAVGDTSLNFDTGTGTILSGDVITAANGTPADANKYVINTALSGGVAIIGGPGLRSSHIDNDAITVGNNYTPNAAFHKAAIELAMRPFAAPPGGDAAVDEMVVQDAWSGLTFVIRVYKGYLKMIIDVQCLYGIKVWKPDFIALLLG